MCAGQLFEGRERMREYVWEKTSVILTGVLSRMNVKEKIYAILTVFFCILCSLMLAVDGLLEGTPDWVALPGGAGFLGVLASGYAWIRARKARHRSVREYEAKVRRDEERLAAEHQESSRQNLEPPELRRRKRVPREVREEVFRRDGGRCVECGDNFDIQYDHIIPWSRGGADSVENLQLLCSRCNQSKGNRHVY